MDTRIDEIANNIFRISLWTDRAPISFNQFVINDYCPTLIHTGHAALFDTVRSQVEQILDPRTLRYISFSHFEADECGALNRWLRLAPSAEVLSGSVAARTSISDFSERAPRTVADEETIELGAHALQMIEPPHFPHNWDAVLWLEPNTGVLFGSDLGTHTGQREAVTDEDRSPEIINFVSQSGYMAPGSHVTTALSRLRALPITCLAAMHGSAIQGAALQKLYDALEEACGAAS